MRLVHSSLRFAHSANWVPGLNASTPLPLAVMAAPRSRPADATSHNPLHVTHLRGVAEVAET